MSWDIMSWSQLGLIWSKWDFLLNCWSSATTFVWLYTISQFVWLYTIIKQPCLTTPSASLLTVHHHQPVCWLYTIINQFVDCEPSSASLLTVNHHQPVSSKKIGLLWLGSGSQQRLKSSLNACHSFIFCASDLFASKQRGHKYWQWHCAFDT